MSKLTTPRVPVSGWRRRLIIAGVTVSAVLYAVAAIGSRVHPYPEKISLARAFAGAFEPGWRGLIEADLDMPALPMACAMYLVLAVYLRVRDGAPRLVVAISSLLLTMLPRGVMGVVAAPVMGPPILLLMVSGGLDGEDYQEAFAVLGPLGIWFWLWLWAAAEQTLALLRARRSLGIGTTA